MRRQKMTRNEMLEILRSTGRGLGAATDGLNEEELRWEPAPGEWSIKEVVCHMREFSEVYSDRLERTIAEYVPFLKGYDQEALAREKDYQNAEWSAVVPSFIEHRRRALKLLSEMGDDGWGRGCHHEEAGPLRLEDLVARMASHDLMHLEQIEEIRRAIPTSQRASS